MTSYPYPRLVVDNSSSDNSTPRSRATRNNGKCHLPGTPSRSNHLRIASCEAPAREPSSLMRSIVEEDELSIYYSMDNLSTMSSIDLQRTTSPPQVRQKRRKYGVLKKLTDYEFNVILRKRLARFRNEADKTQDDMALLLRMEKSAYSKYETRAKSKLPVHLIEPVEVIFGISPGSLVTHRLSLADLEVLAELRKPKPKAKKKASPRKEKRAAAATP